MTVDEIMAEVSRLSEEAWDDYQRQLGTAPPLGWLQLRGAFIAGFVRAVTVMAKARQQG